jgi:hypothetical protein
MAFLNESVANAIRDDRDYGIVASENWIGSRLRD